MRFLTWFKGHWYVFVLPVVVAGGVALGYRFQEKKVDRPVETVTAPPVKNPGYFPPRHYTVGTEKEWRINIVRPVIKSLYTRGESLFLRGEFENLGGKMVEADFLLTGKMGGEVYETVAVASDSGEIEMDALELGEILIPGSQIEVDYLAVAPSADKIDREWCTDKGRLCDAASVVAANPGVVDLSLYDGSSPVVVAAMRLINKSGN